MEDGPLPPWVCDRDAHRLLGGRSGHAASGWGEDMAPLASNAVQHINEQALEPQR